MKRKNIGTITDDERMKQNYAEYTVKKKADFGDVAKKGGIILLALSLLAGGSYLLLAVIRLPVAIVPLCLAVGVICWFLWGRASVEYDYIIYGGEIIFGRIYGERSYTEIARFRISALDSIKAVTPSDARMISETLVCGNLSSDRLYRISQGGKNVLFEAPERTLAALKYYNKNAFEFMPV